MCGENPRVSKVVSGNSGSPPHVRGKLFAGKDIDGGRGITPACAGKTYPVHIGFDDQWDHPRMCGENNVYDILTASNAGSPPHVRGKLPW